MFVWLEPGNYYRYPDYGSAIYDGQMEHAHLKFVETWR